MDDFWGLVIVLVLVLTALVAGVVRLMKYWARYKAVQYPRAAFDATKLKTGDVVLFVAHVHGLTNSLATFDFFSHAGVAVREGGALWLSESVAGAGARRVPLAASLRAYPGTCYLMALRAPLGPAAAAGVALAAAERAPYPALGALLRAAARLPARARHCMQHVAWLVDAAGLTPAARLRAGSTLLASGIFGSSRAVTALPGEPLGAAKNNEYLPIRELVLGPDPPGA